MYDVGFRQITLFIIITFRLRGTSHLSEYDYSLEAEEIYDCNCAYVITTIYFAAKGRTYIYIYT